MVKQYVKTKTRNNFTVDHALLKDIAVVINKFWKQIPLQVIELVKRSKLFINETVNVHTSFNYYNAEFVNQNKFQIDAKRTLIK